ncbi:MAG: 16S rRNA (cytidine(1402)-2'-O)-methyltransferase [Candidatus Hydrogenedentes bacterium]|nr:16S rRNA (cytidine(1402)-2'-O)-methyltransferase [Candidatus Hydrogenedentota bacterium]
MGTLYLVSTPIGNLEDITMRAVRLLGEVDLIAAEDTRKTRRLLDRYDIRTRMTSVHEHNERHRVPNLLNELENGADIALVSNAGTPNLSDPGFVFVREAIARGITVTPVPGANAMLAALTASGLATHRFVFEGFLPRKKGARQKRLETIANGSMTAIVYESPYRMAKLLAEIRELMPDRRLVVARELTKIHEEFLRGTATELAHLFEERTYKGEFTVVIEGLDRTAKSRT